MSTHVRTSVYIIIINGQSMLRETSFVANCVLTLFKYCVNK